MYTIKKKIQFICDGNLIYDISKVKKSKRKRSTKLIVDDGSGIRGVGSLDTDSAN